MPEFNSFTWFDLYFLPYLLLSFGLNLLAVYFWRQKVYRFLGLSKYKAIQRIHLHETPRLGGMVILITLMLYVLTAKSSESNSVLKLLLISISPAIFFACKEDLFHNVRPMIRLASLLICGFLFVGLYSGPWPQISLPVIGPLLSTNLGILLFYPIAMTAVANGMNLIDGVNGLCAMVSLSILGALIFLSHQLVDTPLLIVAASLTLLVISFLIFNYPKGLIFLGDLGAYSLGLILSMLIVMFYGRHPELPSWGAALIIIYPLTEVAFSLFRRLLTGVSAHHPDLKHLHLKLYLFFKPQPSFKEIANAIVMPALALLWLLPFVAITWAYQKPYFIFLGIAIFAILYGLIYLKIPTPSKKNKR
jgi:UDP-N-acetylmuramyl pentapeptide phosphotransferase/UDP-N-acetylglucosamine-1-phosphate transferase